MMDRLTTTGLAFSVMAKAMYVDRMTIRRQTSTKGPTGGNILGLPVILAANVPCRIKPASAAEREIAGATEAITAFTIRAPAFSEDSELIEIDERCELVIAARDGGVPEQILKCVAPLPNNGVTFEVVATK